jgi:hypothetical protein
MELTEDLLRRRARKQYELGRLRHTLQDAWPVVPIIALGALYHSNAALIVSVGAGLFALATIFSWLGQNWRQAIFPGFLAGAPPLLIPPLVPANAFCWIGGRCWVWCVLLCPLSGLIAGAVVGVLATRHQDRGLHFLAAVALIAGLTGALGCSVAGILGIVGMLAGGLLGLMPAYIRHQVQ